MQSRLSKNRVVIVLALAAVTTVPARGASAQPVPKSATIRPGPLNRPGLPLRSEPITPPRLSGEDAEAFKRSIAAHEQCKRDKAAEIRLVEASNNVVNVRDKRPFWEAALKNNSTLRSQNPQGYEQLLARSFEEYRSLGGTLASVNAVRSAASPCTNPWETYRSPSVPLTDSRQIPVPPK